MLEALLRDQYPGVDFDVVNSATTAINSHVVYAMARAAARLDPDVFVIYEGNNEVVGPFGAGTVLTARTTSLPILRAGVALRSTRVGQLARAAVEYLESRGPGSRSEGSWNGMEMFLDRPVSATDARLQRTYQLFERNLVDICRVGEGAGVPVVVSTVGVNMRSSAPFGSVHGRSLSADELRRFDEAYGEGKRFEHEARWSEAADRFSRAMAIDDGYAELQYRLGRCEWSLGRYDDARGRYHRALDLDALRFRADERINGIIRDVAGREHAHGVRLADGEARLAGQAPHGVPGEETFLDHVHLTFGGNYRLSLVLLESIREALPERVRSRASGRPILTEGECEDRLVYTDLDRYRIAETMLQRLQQPPFTGQMDHAEQIERYSREMAALRAAGEAAGPAVPVRQYEEALSRDHPRWEVRERYAVIEGRLGNKAVAEREWRRLAEEFPLYPSFRMQLARTLRDVGRYAEAEDALRQVLQYQPESSLVLTEMARLALSQGRAREAISRARRAVELDPADANAHYVLATTLCQEPCRAEDRGEAIDQLNQALGRAPDSEPVKRDLARAEVEQARGLLERNRQSEAAVLLEKALELKPDIADAHEMLGLLYQRMNEREKAIRHLSAALEADPGRERVRQALESLGK
jgi:tetratricopeptide (TPR) repeat protein